MQRYIRALLVLIVLCLSLADASVVSAAPAKKTAEDPPSKSYVVPYFLVGLSITLGLLVVCRSGSRADQSKITDLH